MNEPGALMNTFAVSSDGSPLLTDALSAQHACHDSHFGNFSNQSSKLLSGAPEQKVK